MKPDNPIGKSDNLAHASSSATWTSLAEPVHAEAVELHGS